MTTEVFLHYAKTFLRSDFITVYLEGDNINVEFYPIYILFIKMWL